MAFTSASRIVEPTTVYGELYTAEARPVVQLQYHGGIHKEKHLFDFKGSATATAEMNGNLKLSTGTANHSVAWFRSKRMANYEPGEGMEIRFSAAFDENATDSSFQYVGYGDQENGIFMGYRGSTPGVLHRHSGVSSLDVLTITHGATISGTVIVTIDGSPHAVSVLGGDSVGEVVAKIANVYSGFVTHSKVDMIEYYSIEAGPTNGIFLFNGGATGVTGSFAHLQTGMPVTENWTPRTAWNIDKADGSFKLPVLDFTKGNVFSITFQWLGYGIITFKIENPLSGRFETVHLITYASTHRVPYMGQSSHPISFITGNGTSGQAITILTGSASIFIQGKRNADLVRWSHASEYAVSNDTFNLIFAMRSKPVVNGKKNKSRVYVDGYTMGSSFTGGITQFKIILNPIIVGSSASATLVWETIDNVEVTRPLDESFTVSGGNCIRSQHVGSEGGLEIDLERNHHIILAANDVFAIVARTTGFGNGPAFAGITWTSDY